MCISATLDTVGRRYGSRGAGQVLERAPGRSLALAGACSTYGGASIDSIDLDRPRSTSIDLDRPRSPVARSPHHPRRQGPAPPGRVAPPQGGAKVHRWRGDPRDRCDSSYDRAAAPRRSDSLEACPLARSPRSPPCSSECPPRGRNPRRRPHPRPPRLRPPPPPRLGPALPLPPRPRSRPAPHRTIPRTRGSSSPHPTSIATPRGPSTTARFATPPPAISIAREGGSGGSGSAGPGTPPGSAPRRCSRFAVRRRATGAGRAGWRAASSCSGRRSAASPSRRTCASRSTAARTASSRACTRSASAVGSRRRSWPPGGGSSRARRSSTTRRRPGARGTRCSSTMAIRTMARRPGSRSRCSSAGSPPPRACGRRGAPPRAMSR
jgi:hypothetical protein